MPPVRGSWAPGHRLGHGLAIGMKHKEATLTQKALQALTEAVAGVGEDHRRRGIRLAVWRNGKAVLIPADEADLLRRTPLPTRRGKGENEERKLNDWNGNE